MLWTALYCVLVGLPVVVMVGWPGAAAGRPMLMQVGVACGFVAMAVFALEFALIAKIRPVAAAFGMDGLVRLHRRMGYVATALVAGHVGALLANGLPVEWLLPWGEFATWEMRWGVGAAVALVVLVVTTVERKVLGLSYEHWEWTHNVMAKLVVLLGVAHLWMFGGFSSEPVMRGVIVAYGAGLVGVVVWLEVWIPLRLWARPWEVVESKLESKDTRTLVLRPKGHGGLQFAAGQFAWLSEGNTLLHKERHPISMSSAPGGETIAFTVKALGDWSGAVVRGEKDRATFYVDGPYGVFTPVRHPGPGYVLIGGGIGVTPLVAMCEEFAAKGEKGPVWFFYGSEGEGTLRFRERLEQLPAKVVFALEKPGEGWRGERGFVNRAMLERYLPENYRELEYFVCGPEAMMDAMERVLAEMGVPRPRVHTERFVLV